MIKYIFQFWIQMPLHFKFRKIKIDTLIFTENYLQVQLIESFYIINFWVLLILSEMILLLIILLDTYPVNLYSLN